MPNRTNCVLFIGAAFAPQKAFGGPGKLLAKRNWCEVKQAPDSLTFTLHVEVEPGTSKPPMEFDTVVPIYERDDMSGFRCLVSETNGIQLLVFATRNRTFGSYSSHGSDTVVPVYKLDDKSRFWG
jgi:hypothetical protein